MGVSDPLQDFLGILYCNAILIDNAHPKKGGYCWCCQHCWEAIFLKAVTKGFLGFFVKMFVIFWIWGFGVCVEPEWRRHEGRRQECQKGRQLEVGAQMAYGRYIIADIYDT